MNTFMKFKRVTITITAVCLLTSAGADAADDRLAKSITVAGASFDPAAPPAPLMLRPDLGLVTAPAVDGSVVYQSPQEIYETRATITPGGDYLLMFPEGKHYAGGKDKCNSLVACRSSDKGKTWTEPIDALGIDYSQHGFIPLIPSGSQRIYAFGTQPIPDRREGRENCPIGFRYSDDDGRTWSGVALIRPTNDPDFKGMSVMRMCETDAGTWLLGSHHADWSKKPIATRLYVMRSEDRGNTWTVAPGARPGGWFAEEFDRMDEGRPINLGGGNVMMMARTPAGHLWATWSGDDGRTWTDPQPTPLVHPDAPPMLFPHPDGKRLIALHHNRSAGGHFKTSDRSEVWVSLSADGGHAWTEPRFLFANALAPTMRDDFRNHQCSYIDAFTDGDVLQLFVPHRWKRALHLRVKVEDLQRLPTKATWSADGQ